LRCRGSIEEYGEELSGVYAPGVNLWSTLGSRNNRPNDYENKKELEAKLQVRELSRTTPAILE
jgi:hypothetical protein